LRKSNTDGTTRNKAQCCAICSTPLIPASTLAKVRLAGDKIYDLLPCSHCGVALFEPIPTNDELAYHYSAAYDFYKSDNFKEKGKGTAFAGKFLKHKKTGNFIDIGCASGDFLAGVQQGSQWNVFGTDINPDVVESVRNKLNLDIRAGELGDVAFEAKFFDFIRIQDILEHVPDPVAFLKECRRIIRDDGSLYLSVPNGLADIQNIINYFASKQTPVFSQAGHIYFLPFETLQYLFKEVGFKIEKSYSYNFKKGLRSFCLLPKKKGWENSCVPPSENSGSKANEVGVSNKKKRSALYYKYIFFQDSLSHVLGAHKYGQDFIFHLRPC